MQGSVIKFKQGRRKGVGKPQKANGVPDVRHHCLLRSPAPGRVATASWICPGRHWRSSLKLCACNEASGCSSGPDAALGRPGLGTTVTPALRLLGEGSPKAPRGAQSLSACLITWAPHVHSFRVSL